MRYFGCLLALSLAVFAGCSGGASDDPDLVPASGTVLYKDKPVAGADVTFVIEKSPLAMGTTNAEGKFVLTTGGRPGAPFGNAKVSVTKTASGAVGKSDPTPEDMMKMAQQTVGKKVEPPKPEIPTKYSDPSESGLTAALDKDGSKNVFEFRLQD